MRASVAGRGLVLAMLWVVAAMSHAQVYKWSDASGKVHYTDNKDEADRANGRQLKVAPGPTEADRKLALQNLQQQAERSRYQREVAVSSPRPQVAARPAALPWHTADGVETDQSRCNLARNIKSGAVVRISGPKVDANDRAVADSDIANFCH